MLDPIKQWKDEQKIFDIDVKIQEAWDDANIWHDQYITIPIAEFKKEFLTINVNWDHRFMSNPYSSISQVSHVFEYPKGKIRKCEQIYKKYLNNIYKWEQIKKDMLKNVGFDSCESEKYTVKIVVTKNETP